VILDRRLRPAARFSVIPTAGGARLVAGEDLRYTVRAPRVTDWLSPLLTALDGRRPLREVLEAVTSDSRQAALEVVERLYGERALVEASAEEAHRPSSAGLAPVGSGRLFEAFTRRADDGILLLCQDTLDYDEVLEFNRRGRSGSRPYFWATIGPTARAFLSPAILPSAGPCLECLVRHFRRLSPLPELYEEVAEHARRGGLMEAASFPEPALDVFARLVGWKAALLQLPDPPPALFRLHVLEVGSLTISSHRVFPDVDCPTCLSTR